VLPSPRPVPDLPHRFTVDTAGAYEVHVDVADATNSVVWLDNRARAQMARHGVPGRLLWWTTLDCEAGQLVQLECDGEVTDFLVRPEPSDTTPPAPLPSYGVGVGVARG